jgi:hypothetical protein
MGGRSPSRREDRVCPVRELHVEVICQRETVFLSFRLYLKSFFLSTSMISRCPLSV